ncbi:MAG: FecR domain-containing protein [Pseudomonadota bacterium]|nr:FecR domain-containing protein [Pseudomonadota bacterium]
MARSDDNDNVVPFPGTAATEEAAALWLARLNAGLDAAGRAKLDAWLRESPQHAQALRDMAAFWGDGNLLAGLDLHEAAAPRVSARALRYAAMFVAAIGLGMAMYVLEPARDVRGVAAVQYERTFTTAIGERRAHDLPDGSVITLNTNTEVRVRYHERDRVVELRRGEAHFAVAYNPERPFGVHAAGHIVQAVGTAFNVRLQQAGAAEVTVTEGRVQILDAAEAAAGSAPAQVDEWWTRPALGSGLVSGQVAVFDARDGVTTLPQVRELDPDALETRLAWQDGTLVFESETLAEVLAEFSRYTAVDFVLDDPQLGEQRIAGVIVAGDVVNLVETLRENFGIDTDADPAVDQRIVLRQRE